MTPKRIQRQRTKGCRMPEGAIWDRTEVYVPALSASIVVVPATPIAPFDFANDAGGWVTGVSVGDLTVHFGLYNDADTVAVIDRLIDLLHELRESALRRLPGPLPTADEVLGIVAEPVKGTVR